MEIVSTRLFGSFSKHRLNILEKIFNVSIIGVNTCILPTKKDKCVGKFVGKRPLYKKAYVKKEGDTIADLLIKLKS
jgi:ribosomal protein L23